MMGRGEEEKGGRGEWERRMGEEENGRRGAGSKKFFGRLNNIY
jgi:hypothetical protein